MFRVCGRIYKKTKCVKNITVNIEENTTRTKKVFAAMELLCNELDLASPIWLDSNIKDFKLRARTRFTAANFVENIEFDYFDFQIVEED